MTMIYTRTVLYSSELHLTAMSTPGSHWIKNCGPNPVWLHTKTNNDTSTFVVTNPGNNALLLNVGERAQMYLDYGSSPTAEGVYCTCAIDSTTSIVKTWEAE